MSFEARKLSLELSSVLRGELPTCEEGGQWRCQRGATAVAQGGVLWNIARCQVTASPGRPGDSKPRAAINSDEGDDRVSSSLGQTASLLLFISLNGTCSETLPGGV